MQACLLNVVGQTHELQVSVSDSVSGLATNSLPPVAHLEQNSVVSVHTICSWHLLMVSGNQHSGAGLLFANAQNILITGGTFVSISRRPSN